MLDDNVRLGLSFVSRRRHARANLPLAIYVDDDAVFAQLLLNKNDFFRSFYYKVSSRVERTLAQPSQLFLALSHENTPRRAKHERNAADGDAPNAILARAGHDFLAARVLHVYSDRCGVRHVTQTALLRRDVLDNVILLHTRLADVDVGVLKIEVGVGVARHSLVGLGVDDLLNLFVDEVVEAVDVLPDQTTHFEERRKQLEFILQGFDGGGELGRIAQEAVLDVVPDPIFGQHGVVLIERLETHLHILVWGFRHALSFSTAISISISIYQGLDAERCGRYPLVLLPLTA
mmetsp:Transcript_27851/g.69934  ORF Transcript_27851/g.69934 Transcript_27851/m.69934 type:complete len:290 (+) Transcript_27851:2987-3856(+)